MYIRRFISVVAAMLAIGVCIFITYISREVDFTTILFNLAFLIIMLVILAASCFAGLRRLMHVCKGLRCGIDSVKNGALDLSNTSEDGVSVFQNSFLDDCYRQYRHIADRNPDTSCDIRTFINEEAIETYTRRSLLEMIPDILTSLGVLGTFVGLVMGLRGFDPSGYEQMAGSVTPLINGIKVAFMTSIYGLSLSLAFSFNVRSEFSSLCSLVEEFLDAYYLNVRPPYEVDSLSKLLDSQKSRDEMTKEIANVFVEQMAKSFDAVITPAYNRMSKGITHVVESFTQSQTEVMAKVSQSVIQQMRSELNTDFTKLNETILSLEKAQTAYIDFTERSMIRMQQTFDTLHDTMMQMEQYSASSFDRLNTAQKEALRISQSQRNAYQDYARFLYRSIEKFSDVWEKNSERIEAHFDEIDRMGLVASNHEILENLTNMSLQLTDIEKCQRVAELSSDASANDHSPTFLLHQTIQKLDKLTEMIDRPRLFGIRQKK